MHNLIQFLENTCISNGGKTAVEAADGSLSFAQLRETALRVAAGIGTGRQKGMVIVYMPKGRDFLSAMLGTLYNGSAYVPMDYRAPVNRTKLIIDIAAPKLIITDERGKEYLAENGVPAELLCEFRALVAENAPMSDEDITKTISQTRDVDPAYLLFTSGSTGVPKGVVIPHRRVINYINWACGFFSLGGDEVIGNQAPFSFTVSVMDIYLSLATGSKLCIIPEDRFSRPGILIEYLNEHEITLIFWVSSVYQHVAKAGALSENRPKFLRRAWFVGEPMSAASLAHWMAQLPDVEFTNLYGSTETDMTICHHMPKGQFAGDVPLGKACANIEVFLIKDDLTAAKPGEIGEICVRGSCLASGYYKDGDKTRAAFIQNPFNGDYPDIIYKTGDLGELRDGLIYFHGRKDHQFKHLGYRIEAGEIEAIAEKFPMIKNVCALYDGEKRQIVLFYEAGGEIDEALYRRALMEDLPVYMVPTRFVKLDKMPFNANQKKDRPLLKAQYLAT